MRRMSTIVLAKSFCSSTVFTHLSVKRSSIHRIHAQWALRRTAQWIYKLWFESMVMVGERRCAQLLGSYSFQGCDANLISNTRLVA